MTARLREAAEEALSHLVIGSAGSDLDEHRAVTHAIEILRAALAEQPKRVPLTATDLLRFVINDDEMVAVNRVLCRALGITGDSDES